MFSERRGTPLYHSYYILLILAELFGFLSVVLIGVLYGKKENPPGYDWSKSPFNFHPLMMTIGLSFCYGNAILSYRTFSSIPKLTVKFIHALLLALSLVFAVVGFIAIIRSKNRGKHPHFMSFHAWLGLITLILFALQWVGGFTSFLVPKLSLEMRQRYMPTHRFWGRTIFIFALGTLIMGLTDMGGFFYFFVDGDAKRKERLMLIFFGLFTVGFGVLVVYLLDNADFRRPSDENTDA